ncbi:hypothetical protein [Xylella fastidiosa]|uniref:hypothetical protein n=1 Tax=Xylella fastidiosa TaxID=2371 RepID=UPI0039850B1F
MPWASLIPAAGSILGSIISNRSAHRAADAQTQASQAAIAEQQRQYKPDTFLVTRLADGGSNCAGRTAGRTRGDYSGFQAPGLRVRVSSRGCRREPQRRCSVVRCIRRASGGPYKLRPGLGDPEP